MVRLQQHILQTTRKYVLEMMAANDAAHDMAHIDRMVKTARLLAQQTGADLFRTQMLALLHELEDDKLASNVGSSSVETMLSQLQLRQEDIAFLLRGIPYISYRKHPKLEMDIPLEIRIVQDADRMDAMGAVGIARTFAYGGAKGRDLRESLQHFDEKLLKLYDLLTVPEAKEMAKSRHEFLKAFYHQFTEETCQKADLDL